MDNLEILKSSVIHAKEKVDKHLLQLKAGEIVSLHFNPKIKKLKVRRNNRLARVITFIDKNDELYKYGYDYLFVKALLNTANLVKVHKKTP